MNEQQFENVWDAIGDTPQEVLNLKLRSQIMDVLSGKISAEGWTQAEAAKRFGVTQPRVSDLTRGKISLFSLDALVNMLAAANIETEVVMKG